MNVTTSPGPTVLIVPGIGRFEFDDITGPTVETRELMTSRNISVTIKVENSKPSDGDRQ